MDSPQTLRKRILRTRGQSLVEFALIAPIFIFLIFGVVDLGRMFYVQMTLENAIRQAGRFGVTGACVANPSNPGNYYTRVQSIQNTAQAASNGLITNLSDIKVSSNTGGNNTAGGPGDTVTVTMTANVKLFTPLVGQFVGPNNTYTFTVSVSFRNEPFNPNTSQGAPGCV